MLPTSGVRDTRRTGVGNPRLPVEAPAGFALTGRFHPDLVDAHIRQGYRSPREFDGPPTLVAATEGGRRQPDGKPRTMS
jgi:hypothetical protein